MILDGRKIPANSVVEADICIVGAGAAGITLGMELAGKKLSVVILESGGLEPAIETQSLYEGQDTGHPYLPLDSCRLRYFGGTTGHWGGWCRPFDPIDFEKREWIPHSGWPIEFQELARFYPKAHEICGISDQHFDVQSWDLSQSPPLSLTKDVITKLIQFSRPLRFGTDYRQAIADAANVRVLLHSNLVEIALSPNGQRVDSLAVATLSGLKFTVKAKHYVLATGGIENARLLLASNRVAKQGIGNDRDLVGRFFMDHIQLDCALVWPLSPEANLGLYEVGSRYLAERMPVGRTAKPIGVMGYLALSETLQRRARVVNYSAHVYPTSWSEFFLRVHRNIKQDKSAWRKTADALQKLWPNLKEATDLAIERMPGREKKPLYKIQATQEQSPNPDSRITLCSERDALGIARARLHWRLSDIDQFSAMESLRWVAVALGAGGIARVQVPTDFSKEGFPAHMGGCCHHYGVTRMSSGPSTGVVDTNCRVHGVANLFVAGSSVFPTSGNGNPTLSIVAMSLRLAQHLTSISKQT